MTTRHTAETDPRTSRRPNTVNRIRSRQSGHPAGALGRIIGRPWSETPQPPTTAPSNSSSSRSRGPFWRSASGKAER